MLSGWKLTTDDDHRPLHGQRLRFKDHLKVSESLQIIIEQKEQQGGLDLSGTKNNTDVGLFPALT